MLNCQAGSLTRYLSQCLPPFYPSLPPFSRSFFPICLSFLHAIKCAKKKKLMRLVTRNQRSPLLSGVSLSKHSVPCAIDRVKLKRVQYAQLNSAQLDK